jgi:hypothetical protein
MPLQIRRGTEAERQSLAQTPQSGELIYVTDTEQLYVGDGFTLLRDLSPITGYTDENAVDALGSVFTGSAHSGISFTYNDIGNEINAVVSQPSLLQNLNLNNFSITGTGNINITGSISVNGLLRADFQGSIVGDDSTILVDAVDKVINLDGTVRGDIIPVNNEAYDIGSAAKKFKDIYLSGTSIFLGDATITNPSSTIVNLPAGSTVGGNIILASGTDGSQNYAVLDIQGSVYGDDSTKLIDAVEGKIVGNVDNTEVALGFVKTKDITTAGLLITGLTGVGGKAGVTIETDGDADDPYNLFYIKGAANDGPVGQSMVFERSRGTLTSRTTVQDGDEILGQYWFGYDGTGTAPTAAIVSEVDGTVSTGIVPGRLYMGTSDATGALQIAISIDSSQVITVKSNTVTAGVGSGEADISSVATYLKIIIGTTEYAIPAYAINP